MLRVGARAQGTDSYSIMPVQENIMYEKDQLMNCPRHPILKAHELELGKLL